MLGSVNIRNRFYSSLLSTQDLSPCFYLLVQDSNSGKTNKSFGWVGTEGDL